MFAVIQVGYGILGLGGTRHDAETDAAANGADVSNAYHHPDADECRTHGNVLTLPCTDRLSDAVERDGWDIDFEVREGGVIDLTERDA